MFRRSFPFFAQDTGDPAFQCIFILYCELCRVALGLHGLVEFLRLSTSLSVNTKKVVSLGLARYSASFFPTGFEEPGIFEEHNTALCQKKAASLPDR